MNPFNCVLHQQSHNCKKSLEHYPEAVWNWLTFDSFEFKAERDKLHFRRDKTENQHIFFALHSDAFHSKPDLNRFNRKLFGYGDNRIHKMLKIFCLKMLTIVDADYMNVRIHHSRRIFFIPKIFSKNKTFRGRLLRKIFFFATFCRVGFFEIRFKKHTTENVNV